ncbi:FAD-dependent oxidoreductase [Streptomyces sp. TR1341]|uniref:NADPH-dependent 2,4-dienoyl-CoA reductase/sulfur reductase-like enzyme n=1 Tax=Streptomyces murinus TaxID=33900 RepID=A0A7W3NVL8_STRMR|nr:FAD-dependent oxidoreductase [Streptomyces murinus]NDK23366.1 FAD-dependent oxidoreductase [Streptomyces sp. TR1341]MBA9057512.1 NADPH-dependent 2,4-dienoyl-CoA reductase/sulfur reductase-like enzyme [Streptomyces murinus]UWW91808.1 FAD-dependent oxidoreductase [Streptomyces murinus]WSI89097.1 FAD-dependent oxidoreductase [Streptomyces murinus]WUD10766.1 FAD-dependent oxidoreductase [Streptomyces murinus]
MPDDLMDGRIVVVGASLAGLRAAEALREQGFTGSLTVVGDEPHPPYDRPPLSKQVLLGVAPADSTGLPMRRDPEAEWVLGVRATGLDTLGKRVLLDNGESLPYDRVLIATGTRARPWPNPAEAALDGVFTVRTREDAAGLAARLDAGPRRVLVIGAGFTGSEIASACRERGLEVTVTERGPAPLVGALGGTLSKLAAVMQRNHGVDLRTGVTVTRLLGEKTFTGVELSDGNQVDADVCVVALGAVRNVEWLADSGLAAGPRGLACDAGCRAFTMYGIVTDDVFVAGDVSRFPHPLFGYQLLSLEHWGNAVTQAEVAAHNMVNPGPLRRPHLALPTFWSTQFGLNIKSVGVPTYSDHVVIAQGSLEARRLAMVYGYRGRVTAAVTVDMAKSLDYYQHLIETGAPFPPPPGAADRALAAEIPIPSDVPDPSVLSHGPTVALTGYLPDRRLTVV